jgi:hypothetical protein
MRWAGLLLFAALPCAAQTTPKDSLLAGDPIVQEALRAASEWTARVRAGELGTWSSASPRLRARIAEWLWQEWTSKHVSQWEGVGAARVVSLDWVIDDAEEPPVEGVGAVLVHDRARGGKVFERIWVVRQGNAEWTAADYALWVDGAATMTNAYVRPIPWVVDSPRDHLPFVTRVPRGR